MNVSLESCIRFFDEMEIENAEYIDVANESLEAVIPTIGTIIAAGVLITNTVSIALESNHRKEIDRAVSLYKADHPELKSLSQLKHKTYKIKPFTEAEKGKEIKNSIRKWLVDRSNRVIQVYFDEKGKELFYFVFSNKSIKNKTTGTVDVEFYICDKSLKEHANYYMALGCRARRLTTENLVVWARKYNGRKNANLSKVEKFASYGRDA